MVSSAIYRYFPSRDDLLTALIIDGYDALGEAVELADAARPPDDFAGRWLGGLPGRTGLGAAHPHEYALLYGSPVPGYRAPGDTVEPASRARGSSAGSSRTPSRGAALPAAHPPGATRDAVGGPRPGPVALMPGCPTTWSPAPASPGRTCSAWSASSCSASSPT